MQAWHRSRIATLLTGAVSVGLGVASCANTPAADVCEQARVHVHECLGVEVAATECVPAEAENLLAQDCVALDDGKADIFASGLCRLGFLSACKVPSCNDTAPSDTCADYINREDCSQCDYYTCREAHAPTACGAQGYYLDFAYDYCRRYKEVTASHMSAAGQKFLHDIRRCLMDTMQANLPETASCSAAETAGFNSHPTCYVQSGFCQLPVTDWILVLATISPSDLNFQQMLVTGVSCLKEWAR